MGRYLVTINQEIEVEADNRHEATIVAAQCFDFGNVDFEVEEIDDD